MMSIEETGNPSASEALAAAMAQVGNLPAGMHYDTSPDYAASGLASDKPGIPGLAEAARQFLENYPTPPLSGDFDNLDNDPSDAVSFTPILVSDRDHDEREALETLRLEKITDLEAALNQADEDSRPKLKVLLEKLEAAKGKDANSIRSAITSASLALSTEAAGGNKGESRAFEPEHQTTAQLYLRLATSAPVAMLLSYPLFCSISFVSSFCAAFTVPIIRMNQNQKIDLTGRRPKMIAMSPVKPNLKSSRCARR